MAPGLYVSQKLRYLPYAPYDRLSRLPRIERAGLIEPVHWKDGAAPDLLVGAEDE